MSMLRGWRPQLRLAWRDAMRSKGRSALVVVMIALPVMGVTAADVVLQTQDVRGAEALERRLGTAQARITFETGHGPLVQDFDPWEGSGSSGASAEGPGVDPSLGTISRTLGRKVQGVGLRQGSIRFLTDRGIGVAEGTELDLTNPLTTGMFELTAGELPDAPGEAAVNRALADRGPGIGDDLELVDGPTLEIVGTVESTTSIGFPRAVALLGELDLPVGRGLATFLVDTDPVTWAEVRELNALGATVISRAVLQDPPPDSALPMLVRPSAGMDEEVIAVVGLIVVMALIEVVLLAGPAFAVGARRQTRHLALIAASGGTPRQGRRVVIASALVLGGIAAVLGVVLGIVAAAAAVPLVQSFDDSRFGPFDVPWVHLVGVSLFGLVSAFLAALVPAWLASRQDVVAVLAGRRGDPPASARSPLLGLVLIVAGVAGSVYGASVTGGEVFIAGAAVLVVLGMVLLLPLVLSGIAKMSRRLPLVLRYAARDAARHRTRTVPAVAAVAATVTGVVALGIGAASDQAESEATYSPTIPLGHAQVSSWREGDLDWERLTSILRRTVPAADISRIHGVPEESAEGEYMSFDFHVPGGPATLLYSYGSALGSSVLVSDDGSLPPGLLDIDGAEAARAETALAAGAVVVFTSGPVEADRVKIAGYRYSDLSQDDSRLPPVTADATFIRVGDQGGTAQAVVPPSVLDQLGVGHEVVGLHVSGATISEAQEADIEEAVAAVAPDLSFYVERGYREPAGAVIVLVVLGALGGVLMLGGTLTATFLALSDARPDLATLSAVGASPRKRRGVAMAYALVVGLVGAVLGAAVGFVPGIAVTRPLTTTTLPGGGGQVGPFLDVPWLLIASIVVALPILTAAVVGLTARSRLPMVARLD